MQDNYTRDRRPERLPTVEIGNPFCELAEAEKQDIMAASPPPRAIDFRME